MASINNPTTNSTLHSNPSQRDTEAAFRWIVTKFRELNIPFQITGGLAAHTYGAKRELADIDFDVPEEHFAVLASALREYITFGPERFLDENWDLSLMTLRYKGQDIDIGGANTTKIFDKTKHMWVPLVAHFTTAEEREIFGLKVPVVNREELVRYKSMLGRAVDLEDVQAISLSKNS